MKKNNLILLALFFAGTLTLLSCKKDAPEEENEEEIITDVTLTFLGGGETITATATDPDGEGPLDLTVNEPINLKPNTAYTLTISLFNSLENEDMTTEVEDEADEHMFFFAFTNNIFSNPTGSGNVSGRDNPVNYEDQDAGGLPLGLITNWTTGTAATGTFRLVLKHQPGIKTATSTAADGESDVDLTWTLNVR